MCYHWHDCRYSYIALWSLVAWSIHIVTYTERTLVIEFHSFHSVVFIGFWSPGCCYEQQCYCTHPMMWLLVYAHLWSVPRSRINGFYVLHVSGLVDALTDADLPSARRIQLMFIKIEKSSCAAPFWTSSTWRLLKSPGVRLCRTIHSGDGPVERQEYFQSHSHFRRSQKLFPPSDMPWSIATHFC